MIKMNIHCRMLFLVLLLIFPVRVVAEDRETVSESKQFSNEEYLLKNAKEYWEKGLSIQYDTPEKYGQSMYFMPEEANSENIIYTNCGAFMSALYMETFGIELPWRTENLEPYMRRNQNTDYVIDSIEQDTYMELLSQERLIGRLVEEIHPGDMLLMRFNSSKPKGHVMMVYELIYNQNGNAIDAWLIHSTGKVGKQENFKSAYDKEKREGSIRISRMSKLLNGFYSKMKGDKSNVYYCGILRPLAKDGEWLNDYGRISKYDVTSSTIARFNDNGNMIDLSCRKNIEGCVVTTISDVSYTGENIVPEFEVFSGAEKEKLDRGKDYIITYLKDDNIKVGDAFVTIMGIGEFYGSKPVHFSIIPSSNEEGVYTNENN